MNSWVDDDHSYRDLVRLFHDRGGSFQHGLDEYRRRELLADWLKQQIDFGFFQVAELQPPPPLPPNPGAKAAKAIKEDVAPVKEKLGWFEVTVVDAWGKPVDGVELEVVYEGTRKKVTTPGNGKVKLPDIAASFGSARITNVKAVRDTLRPRWKDKYQPTDLPEDAENPEKLGLDATELTTSLESETPKTLVLVKPLTRIRLIGMHFDTNKCFLRPSAMNGIKQVVAVYKANPTGKLLILGHTDTTADDNYNLDLSVERAEAIKAYLKDDVAAWEAWFGEGKPKQKRWGDGEVAQMIKPLPCEQTVAGFQGWSNENKGTDLKVDGIAGPKTRKALIEAYMALDGTTLPEVIEAVTHGCGEFFPRTDEGDEFGADGVAAEENRRVEMYCFDDQIFPPVPGPKASKGEPEYEQWKKQVTKTIDASTDDVADPLRVVVYSPTKEEGVLQIRDASGVITRELTTAEGTRTGDHVAHVLDPNLMPRPTQLVVRYEDREELQGDAFDPVTRSLELRPSKPGKKGEKAGVTGDSPDAGVAPLTDSTIEVRIRLSEANYLWMRDGLVVTLSQYGAPVAPLKERKPGETEVRYRVPGPSAQLTFELRINPPADDPFTSSKPYDVPGLEAVTPILQIVQGLQIEDGILQIGPETERHRRVTPVKYELFTPKANALVELEVDLTILDVTNYVRSLKNPSYRRYLGAKPAGNTRVLVDTRKGAVPQIYAVHVPSCFASTASRRETNVFLFFMHEFQGRWTIAKDGTAHEDNLNFSRPEEADYERLTWYLAAVHPNTYFKFDLTVHEYMHADWSHQMEPAGKPVLLVMPFPTASTNMGSLDGWSVGAEATLRRLLTGLWQENLIATESPWWGPSLKRLAVGGWSSGTHTLMKWISASAKVVDEIYFFDGRKDEWWPGHPIDAGDGAFTPMPLAKWLTAKSGRKLRLLGTSYTEHAANQEHQLLKLLAYGEDEVSCWPGDYAYWYTSKGYAKALTLPGAQTEKQVLEGLTSNLKALHYLGRASIDSPELSATQVLGVRATANMAKSSGPSRWQPDVGVTLHFPHHGYVDGLPSGDWVSKTIPRASLAEASAFLRFKTAKAWSSGKYVHEVPSKDSNAFFAMAKELEDRPSPTGEGEPNMAGRFRHAWAILGTVGETSTGHLQRILELSGFD